MAERALHQLPDSDLEAALRGLAPALAWPTAALAGGTDIAVAVRVRVEAMPVPRSDDGPIFARRFGSWRRTWRPARRALVLSLVALLAIAAVVGALGLGLPGLRISLGEAPPTPAATATPSTNASAPSTPAPLGASMRLGDPLDLADPDALAARAGFPVRMPDDPAIGPPETAYIDDIKGGQVTLIWPVRPALPATLQPDVGLLVSQFRGTVGDEFFMKATGANTIIQPVQVGEHDGYWLSGDPHVFFWEGQGGFVDDARRWVGDVLLWSDGAVTYRLETSLGRDEAIRIAESMR